MTTKYNTTGTLTGQSASSNKAAEAANPPLSAVDALQLLLDLAGLIPGAGAIPDVINAAISFIRGDWLGGALSLFSAVPAVGDAAGLAKIVKNSEKYVQAIKVVETKVLPKLPNFIRKPLEEFIQKAKAKMDELTGTKPKPEPKPDSTPSGDNKQNGQVKKVGPKPKCGGRATYAKQAGDFAGNEMERDHIPSFGALKKALLQRAKDREIDLDPADLKSLFGETADANRTGDGGKLGRHAQTIAVPNDVHKAGDTHGAKNTEDRMSGDSKNLQGAAQRDGNTHKRNTKNDKHKDCAGAIAEAAEEIGSITNEQYNKFFDKLLDDTLKGKNTVNPWKGIL